MNMKRNQWLLMLAVAATLSGPAVAQTPAETTAPGGNSTTVHLIRLLVEQGVITDAQANALLQQAQREAQAASQPRPEPDVREGDVRVPYIPEVVRDEIREEVKEDVMAQAKAENWAAPNTFPDWVSRVKVFGDVRVRNESRFFSGDNSDEIIDFQKLNDDGPYDVNEDSVTYLPPLMNTREDRENLLRIRARFGLEAALSENWSTGVRLATGSSNGPVSTTQTLGGGLSKKDIWLDRAWISWRPGNWNFTAGRAENPFVSTDILYSGDLNFDGVSARFSGLSFSNSGSFFGTLGAFPLQYSDDDWPSNSRDKGKSEDRWLLGAQVGANWEFKNQSRFQAAVAYYDFDNLRGQRSSECFLYQVGPPCDTDWSVPAFMQKGNTVFLLRDIQLDPSDPAHTPLPQYVGLASKFQLFDLNVRWDTTLFNGYKLQLAGNYIYNHGYDEQEMWQNAEGQLANNFNVNTGEIESGRDAWMVHAAFGSSLDLKRRGDWMTFLGYKYIKPDALPDAYNDSSFHLGGTNAKGYYLGAAYALNERLYFQGRWMSSEEVYGPPLSIDILQLELNARF
ncbi:hypothetical protein MA04_00400 [Alcanivorax balearicus MACL04]|uniref:Porin n=1 Tax=Alloalcanivorax balearicus MACL04 TaxID=1177182 RepID=A0ABT2QU98_9GAMM|nr:putative porin [Alloalcanivorax balearicus]MCU5781100.1 hypothetical protein [Alloalcanivorax balearicus MACL04]